MNENEWKLKIAEDVASIKTDVKHILKNMCPLCHYPELKGNFKTLKARIDTDRKLILGLIFTYIPLILTLLYNVFK